MVEPGAGRISGADTEMREALADGNARYEARFSHIYLACATGRSASELLAFLRERLDNDRGTEWGVAAAGLTKINQIRICRDTDRHGIRDLNVSTALRGDFDAAHLTGDQARTAAATIDAEQAVRKSWVISGVKDLVLLKSTGSQFTGFLKEPAGSAWDSPTSFA